MDNISPSHTQLSIVPLGAGDLIDRAVRFYRQNLVAFILMAAPPVVAGTLVSVGWMYLSRSIFYVGGSTYTVEESAAHWLFGLLGSFVIWFTEAVAILMVMGGASRNFVRHLLFGEPLSFRDTYRNTRERFFGLLAASILIVFLLGIIAFFIFYFGAIATVLVITLVNLVFAMIPPVAIVVSIVGGVAVLLATYWLFCLIASRFAYVPQVMLVEGQGVFAAVGRSMSLASGNVKRFAALLIFTVVATYSALAILYIPLGWYAWYSGVDLTPFSGQLTPAWYEIASQLLSQASVILLAPVWMVGLCLLYVDERVRHEGYDIELMAARRLGDIPTVPQSYVNPLQPALGSTEPTPYASTDPAGSPSLTTLGLK